MKQSPTSDFQRYTTLETFSTSDQRYYNFDPQRWNNVDPTLKYWLGRAHVKRACSFWCLACKYTSYWLFQMFVYVHYKGLRWDFLTPKKVTDKVDTPKSINAVPAALCLLISELRGRHSQRHMAPQRPRSPNISKCQVSDCH